MPVHFMQSLDGGAIKIGFSDDVPFRQRSLSVRYGTPLAVLATIPGDYDCESLMHERFAHLRLGITEQFRPAKDLLEFIGLDPAGFDLESPPVLLVTRGGRIPTSVADLGLDFHKPRDGWDERVHCYFESLKTAR